MGPLRAGPGLAAMALVVVCVLGPLAALGWAALGGGRGLAPSDGAAVRFTLVQAALSAGLSVALAIPVARALSRRQFALRRPLIALLGAPFLLPAIVAVLGVLAVWGRAGWISTGLTALGLPPLDIYGLEGVVLAHVFFNLPLAVRLILQGWTEVPAERFRLAAQIGAGPRAIWRLIEAPMLARIVPGALAIIFAICLTSFAVALTLGGGPKATTIELAIYQAFRFDFDLTRATLLSALQAGLSILAALLALRLGGAALGAAGRGRPVARWDADRPWLRLQDGAAITLAALLLILPLAAILTDGLAGLPGLPAPVWRAAGLSLAVGAAATLLTLVLALPMAACLALGRAPGLEAAGLLGLAVSPLALGTGLFLLLFPVTDPIRLALPITAMVNALVALPFALRVLVPPARQIVADHGRLALALNMRGGPFFRRVLLPRLRAPIGFAAGLTAALSIGDLGVIALFADPDHATLPLQVQRLMGSYRTDDAAAAAVLLLILSFAAFWLCDRGGRSDAAARGA